MAIEIGDKVLVSIPSPIPSPFSGWANGWKKMLEDVNGTEVEVVDNNSELVGEKGIEFDRAGRFHGYIGFIPFQWVKKSGITYTTYGYGLPIDNVVIQEMKTRPSYMWCNACGGSGKHRLMCPTTKVVK